MGRKSRNFCTRAYYQVETGQADSGVRTKKESLVGFGELSRQDAYQACWEFVHDLSIEQALADSDPLIQTLAVLDARLGKRRLTEIDSDRLHPLSRKLLEIRVEAESANK